MTKRREKPKTIHEMVEDAQTEAFMQRLRKAVITNKEVLRRLKNEG